MRQSALVVILALAILLCADRSAFAQTPDALIVRIYFTDASSLQKLVEQGIDIWEVDHAHGFVLAQVTQPQIDSLIAAGYWVLVDHIKTAAIHAPRPYLPDQISGIPGYACYRTVTETNADLSALAATYPNIARWIDIGDTWDKATPSGPPGYDLNVLVLTNRSIPGPKPTLFVMGSIHAREYAAAETATRFAELLVDGYGVDPEITAILDFGEVHILAQANPDGRAWAEQGYSWRKNTNSASGCAFPTYGVDLNRNSSFKWNSCTGSGCSTGNACNIFFRGTSPGSEPETAALQAYLRTVFLDQRGPADTDPAPVDATGILISLHSYGGLVLYPWDWTPGAAPNDAQLRRLGRKFGFYNGHQVCRSYACLYAFDGSNTDWAYGELGVAAFTVELGTAFFQSCTTFENSILQSNLAALIYAAKAVHAPYAAPAGPEITGLSLGSVSVLQGHTADLAAVGDGIRYDSNGWGVEPSVRIAGAAWSLDLPAWAGAPTLSLAPADGNFNSPVEALTGQIDTSIDPDRWTPGRHTIFVQAQDTAGNWGVPSAIFLDVRPRHDLAVSSDGPTLFAPSAGLITHTITVINTGGMIDTYAVEPVQSGWPINLAHPVQPTAPGDAAVVSLGVRVPATATVGQMDYIVLAISVQDDPQTRRVVTLQTLIDAAWVHARDGQMSQIYLPLFLH